MKNIVTLAALGATTLFALGIVGAQAESSSDHNAKITDLKST